MVFKFFGMVITKGFKQSTANNSLFVKISGNSFMALLVYADNIILASNNQKEVDDLKKFLNECFKLKYFLGLEVARSSKGISLSERHYALQLISNSNLLRCKPSKTSMIPNTKLSQEEGDLFYVPTMYIRVIGKILYLTITR